jgi:hypothetical protein
VVEARVGPRLANDFRNAASGSAPKFRNRAKIHVSVRWSGTRRNTSGPASAGGGRRSQPARRGTVRSGTATPSHVSAGIGSSS